MERDFHFVTNFLNSSRKSSENKKVIVRTFDIPTRNKSKMCDVSQFPRGERNLTSPYKSGTERMRNSKPSPYIVPPVTRVYPGRKSKINHAVTTQKSASVVLSPSVPQNINDINLLSNTLPLVVSQTKSQEVSRSVLPEHTVFLVPPDVRKEKASKGDSPHNIVNFSEKITLNNVPEGVFGNSAEIVDSQLVNGKKVFILKTTKNSSKLEKSLTNSLKNSSLNVEKPPEAIPPLRKQSSIIQNGSDIIRLIDVNNANIYPSVHIPPNKSNNLIIAQVPSIDRLKNACESDRQNKDKQVILCERDQSNFLKLVSSREGAYSCKGTKSTKHSQVEPLKELEFDLEDEIVLIPNDKRVKYVQANASHSTLKQKLFPVELDSPCIGQISEGLTTENLKPKNFNSSNVELQIITSCNEENTIMSLSNVQNPDQLCVIDAPHHSLDPNIDILKNSLQNLKQNINDALYKKREQIALQYHRETQRAKKVRGEIRKIQYSCETKYVVDNATQTSLFSLVEPGRIVEMEVKESTNDCQNWELNNTNFDPGQKKMPISRLLNSVSSDVAMNTIDSSVNIQNNNTLPSVRKYIEEETNCNSSKRMRIDSRGNYLLNSSHDVLLSSGLNSDDQADIYGLSSQINVNNNDKQRKNIMSPQKIEDRLMLACKKLIDKFSNTNIKQIKEKILQRTFMDYKNSLIQDDDGNLPLHHAVMDKDVLKVRKQLHILSAQKETVSVKNIKGQTPLHLAVLLGVNEIIQVLIKWGADLSLQDNHGDTVLHLAILWGGETCFNTIMKNIGHKCPVLDKPNDDGYSPLHLCALKDKQNETKILISKGADVNIRDRKSGRSPLFHAMESGNYKLCRILVDSGASTTIPNFSGQSPLSASEMDFSVPGNKEYSETELDAFLCQSLQRTTVEKNSLQDKSGNYQNQMNLNVLSIDGNIEVLEIPKTVKNYHIHNNR